MIQFGPMIVSGASSFLSAAANKEAGQAVADSERGAATNARIAGFFKNRILRRQQDELQSTIRARLGAGGLDVTQGSPLEAYLQSTRETELDIIHSQRATDSEFNAHIVAANTGIRAGDNAALASGIQGAANILGAKEKADERLKLQALLDKYRTNK